MLINQNFVLIKFKNIYVHVEMRGKVDHKIKKEVGVPGQEVWAYLWYIYF